MSGNSVIVPAPTIQNGWAEKQAASVARYVSDTYNAEEEPILRLFGGFMAVNLARNAKVIDIGCGLTPTLPAYVEELGLTGYFGLEPIAEPVDREFPCLVGAVAEKIPLKTGSIDSAIFATSQDHIADIDKAMAETRRVVRPGGSLYMWIGLYDPEMMAWAKPFHNLTHRGSMAKRILRGALANVEWAHLVLQMRKRSRQLAKGHPIDSKHERWYTRETVIRSLHHWGLKPKRFLVPPGVPGVFVEAVN